MTATAVWLTVRVGKIRVPLPLPLILPVAVLIDLLLAIMLVVIRTREKIGRLPLMVAAMPLSRLVLALLLYGGNLKVSVRDGNDIVQIGAGWRWA